MFAKRWTGRQRKQQIAKLRAEIERLRQQTRRWMALADQRAIEVGTLKTEVRRLQRVIEGQHDG
jgi:hypothetical protein